MELSGHMRSTAAGAARRALVLVIAAACVTGGCAYYNTLYNAKARYREADQMNRDRDGNVTRQMTTAYDEVIEKCRAMIATWPDSRHVDDAMLLMARAYDGSDRFAACVGVLDSLEARYPDTELLPKVLSLKGGAQARAGEHEAAVEILKARLERYPPTASVLYDLSTSLMSLDRSEEAVEYLAILEKEFPKSDETLDARIATAEILASKEQYEGSREVYERLTSQRLPEVVRYRVWMGYAEVDLELQRYADALASLDEVRQLVLSIEQEPPMLLLKADALAGWDSLDAAIATYNDVATRFTRGEYAATAHYRLGMIYEEMDSLEAAKRHYEGVPGAYANSKHARDAIKRGNNIAQLIKLQASATDDSPDALALRQFSLAELQLFQFENTTKAIEAYQKLITEFPDTEYAPKAAYAMGYIYGVLLADSAMAWESYRFLLDRYPDSQQALNARQFVAALGPAPPGVETPTEPAGEVDDTEGE